MRVGLRRLGRPCQPRGARHGHIKPDGVHAGDQPNLYAGSDGTAHAHYFAAAVTLDTGTPHSLFDADISAIVMHEGNPSAIPPAAALEAPCLAPTLEETSEPPLATAATPVPPSTPTPAPLASRFPEIPPFRITTVSELGGEPRFWKDGRPFALLGCQGDARTDDGYYEWTQSGQGSLGGDLTLVNGDVLGRPAREGGCYELAVAYLDTKAYCHRAGRYATPRPLVPCAGESRNANRFIAAGSESTMEASWQEV